jgi:hypothetical protein
VEKIADLLNSNEDLRRFSSVWESLGIGNVNQKRYRLLDVTIPDAELPDRIRAFMDLTQPGQALNFVRGHISDEDVLGVYDRLVNAYLTRRSEGQHAARPGPRLADPARGPFSICPTTSTTWSCRCCRTEESSARDPVVSS